MTTKLADVTDQALALSPAERAQLAQQLWESLDAIHRDAAAADEDAIAEALRRDAELSAGAVPPRSHADVMAAARKAIE